MVKKVPKGTKLKRPKRAKDADKEVPASLNHIRHFLGPWGLDTRKFFKNPLALCSRGTPDATMSEPFYGWIRHGDDSDYQFTYTYGTRLEEPDDPPPSPTSAPNTPSSQVPVDLAIDRREHSAPHSTTSNEGDAGTSPTLINIAPEILARPLTPHIMNVSGGDDYNYSTSTSTTPGIHTPSNNSSYTSHLSLCSYKPLEDETPSFGPAPYLTPYDLDSSLSDEMTLYTSPNPTPEYLPSTTAQDGPYSGTTIPTMTPYASQDPYYPYHPSTPGVDQRWSQPIAYASHTGTHGYPQSAPPTKTTYHLQNMDDHSLAPMIPRVSVGHNVSGVPPTYDPIDGSHHASNIAGPSRPTRTRQGSNRSRSLGGFVPYDSGRRMHPIPPPARNSELLRGFPGASDQVYNYDLDASYLGNDLDLTISSLDPFATLDTNSAAAFSQGNGTSDVPRT